MSTTVTHGLRKYHIPVFWDDEYQHLNYINESFNDSENLALWTAQGYSNQFTGDMCDMRSPQPSWNSQFIDYFATQGWHNIGTSYYRMMTGTVLPMHRDLYVKYIARFDLQGQEHRIRRAVVFLEPWQSGHYFESMGLVYTHWQAGDTVEWNYDTPHMAANIGTTPRYTLQVTGTI